MNLGELKTDALAFLDERSGGSFWSPTIQNSWANLANRLVYGQVAALSPTYLTQHSVITYPASSEYIDLSGAGYLNSVPLKVKKVEELFGGTSVSPSNQPQELHEENPEWTDAYEDHSPYPTTKWWIDAGTSMFLAPTPSSARVLRLRWIDSVDAMTLDADDLLGGRAAPFHDLVLAVYVKILQSKERREDMSMESLRAFIAASIREAEASRTTGMMGYKDPY